LNTEINGGTGQRLRSYIWGLDLSGSLTGAGGVGGLVAVNSASAGTHFCVMDGNGNVVGMVSGTDGSKSAVFEFDPFGRTTRRSGSASSENPFRFSTKRTDVAVDLIAYEYRNYNPLDGRWLSRDPVEEWGGINLVLFSVNSPIRVHDPLGLSPGRGPCILHADQLNVPGLGAGTWARTRWVVNGPEFNRVACPSACNEWVSYSLSCDITTRYAPGHSPSDPFTWLVPPKTLNDHEQQHVFNDNYSSLQ